MLEELFSIVFFCLCIIPSLIGMIWIFKNCIKSKRCPVIVSLILSLLGAIGIYVIVYWGIIVIISFISMALGVGFAIGLILSLILIVLNGDI